MLSRAALVNCPGFQAIRRKVRFARAVATVMSGPDTASTTSSGSLASRAYPDEPRVGVGVVILRQLTHDAADAEALLIRRAKEPAKGFWCFCGGSLELGETLVQCAVREAQEETGLRLRCEPLPEGEVYSPDLAYPTPIAAADSLVHDKDGNLRYHYAIINMAATLEDPHAPPVPADDVDAARWFPVSQLRSLPKLVEKCAPIAEEAVRRFSIEQREQWQ